MSSWWSVYIKQFLFVPAIAIFGGWFTQKHYPKKITIWAGYHTLLSMRNMDTWRFAHEYIGRLWWKIGWLMLIPNVLLPILLLHQAKDTLDNVSLALSFIQVLLILASVFLTERALRKTFDADGIRR